LVWVRFAASGYALRLDAGRTRLCTRSFLPLLVLAGCLSLAVYLPHSFSRARAAARFAHRTTRSAVHTLPHATVLPVVSRVLFTAASSRASLLLYRGSLPLRFAPPLYARACAFASCTGFTHLRAHGFAPYGSPRAARFGFLTFCLPRAFRSLDSGCRAFFSGFASSFAARVWLRRCLRFASHLVWLHLHTTLPHWLPGCLARPPPLVLLPAHFASRSLFWMRYRLPRFDVVPALRFHRCGSRRLFWFTHIRCAKAAAHCVYRSPRLPHLLPTKHLHRHTVYRLRLDLRFSWVLVCRTPYTGSGLTRFTCLFAPICAQDIAYLLKQTVRCARVHLRYVLFTLCTGRLRFHVWVTRSSRLRFTLHVLPRTSCACRTCTPRLPHTAAAVFSALSFLGLLPLVGYNIWRLPFA